MFCVYVYVYVCVLCLVFMFDQSLPERSEGMEPAKGDIGVGVYMIVFYLKVRPRTKFSGVKTND